MRARMLHEGKLRISGEVSVSSQKQSVAVLHLNHRESLFKSAGPWAHFRWTEAESLRRVCVFTLNSPGGSYAHWLVWLTASVSILSFVQSLHLHARLNATTLPSLLRFTPLSIAENVNYRSVHHFKSQTCACCALLCCAWEGRAPYSVTWYSWPLN